MVALEKNSMAMIIHVNSFMTKGFLNKIHDPKHDDWPSGLVWKVHKALIKEYWPTDFAAKVELAGKIQGLRLRKKEKLLKRRQQ